MASKQLLFVTPVLPGKSELLPLLAADVAAIQQAASNNWQITWQVVFDGQSAAEDRQALDGHSFIDTGEHCGAAQARNIAAEAHPTADWIYPIDADDRLSLEASDQLLQILETTELSWVGTSRAFSDRRPFPSFSTDKNIDLPAGEFVNRHQSGRAVPHPNSIAWRYDYFTQLGGWPQLRKPQQWLGANHEDLALALVSTDCQPGLWIKEAVTLFHYWPGNSTNHPEYRRKRQETFLAAFEFLNQDRRRRDRPEITDPQSNHPVFRAEMAAWQETKDC